MHRSRPGQGFWQGLKGHILQLLRERESLDLGGLGEREMEGC